MGFSDAVRSFISRFTDFAGRSSRSEYWWVQLALFIAFFILGLVTGFLGETLGSIIIGIAYLAILVPALALAIRRLHDLDKSGWWMLLSLIPLIGGLVLLFFFVQKGTDGPNQYGPDPLGSDATVFN